jgi:hypothetical protein
MHYEPLDYIPLWILLPLAGAFLALAMEGGYRLGRWRKSTAPDERDVPVGAMVASILGLLALVLGFTFSLAASRFDARRQGVLDEANAIGTTFLRARMLPEPERTETMRLLREYATVRAGAANAEKVGEAIVYSETLHEQLWKEAISAGKKDPGNLTTALFVQSLNEMIDLHATRVLYGLRSRIPLVIWIGLFGLALLGMASVGYQAGISATRRSPAMLALVLAFGAVLYLIADLDRGQEGLLRVSQQALLDVQKSMETESSDSP